MFRRGLRKLLSSVCAAGAVCTALAVPAIGGPAATAAAATPAGAVTEALTPSQALRQARATGKAVAIAGSTTATDTLTANANGSLTLIRALVPVRKRVNGTWTALDATLRSHADGSVSPAVATDELRLSGGGNGPLATMRSQGRSLALTLPFALPKPVLSGDTATYRGVLPGVDLQARADKQGGLSEVFIVRDVAAAANPALRSLRLATAAQGVQLATGADGSLSGVDSRGRTVLSAPPPLMWDSATGSGPVAPDLRSGRPLDLRTGRPATSDARTPGVAAHRAAVGIQVGSAALDLVPDKQMLGGQGVTFPVFIDPSVSWTPIAPAQQAWSSVAHLYPGSNYWNNTPDPDGHLQVGNSNESGGGIWSHSLLNYAIPVSTLAGATINKATIGMTEVWAWSCTGSQVNMYAPAATMTPTTANWNYWAGQSLGGVVDSKVAAHKAGNSTCPAAGVEFNVLSAVNADVAAGKTTQTFVMTGVNESSDWNSWKEFDRTTVFFSIEYNHAPSKPSELSTSPSTPCTGAAVGDGDVKLYARVSDPDANTLGVAFQVWKTSTGTVIGSSDPNLLTYPAGSIAVFTIAEATLKTASGSSVTSFSWKVQSTDGFTSPWSDTCTFQFDPTRTGAPSVTPPAAMTMGQPATFTVTPPSGPAPSAYLYQLNGTAPVSVPAAGTLTVTPTRFTNTLAVTSLSPGGNIGDTAIAIFNADPPATAAASDDLTGDGKSDLLAVGGANSLPAGVWLAAGKSGGPVDPAPTNIGAFGNGVSGANSPADFTGATVVSGRFTGSGLQDLLVYYPGGDNAGGGMVLNGNGDGSPILAQQSGNEHTLPSGLMTDLNGLNPIQIANAGNASHQDLAYPDLLAVNGNASTGYYLAFYPNFNGLGNYPVANQLTTPTPAGDMAWNAWTIATTEVASGTAMFLWNKTTGALYLWTALSYDSGTNTLSYASYPLKTSGWYTGATLSPKAADLNSDGTPDLWVVDASGGATAYLVSGLAGTPAITAQSKQTLVTAYHSWPLTDIGAATPGTPIATSADTTRAGVTPLPLTGTGGVVWNTGDLYSPAAAFDGATGMLTTASSAVDTTQDFSVSVWVKPNGGTGQQNIVTQDGSVRAGFSVFYDGATGSWRFCMAQSDAVTTNFDIAEGPANGAALGVWSQLTATYHRASGEMNLYVNGINVGRTTHTSAWSATGKVRIGAFLYQGTPRDYFNGKASGVQVWNRVVVPPPGPSGLAGAWSLAGSGADSGGSHPLTTTGTTSWVAGRLPGGPQALHLDGASGGAQSAAAVIDTSASFTVSAWVRPTATAYYKTVWSAETSQSDTVAMGMDDTGHWVFWARPSDTVGGVAVLGPAVQLNRWTHLAGVYDASTHQIELYVNGISAGKTTVAAIRTATGFTLGHYQYLGSRYGFFAGDLAEIGAWNRVVYAPELRDLANSPKLLGRWGLAGNGTDTSGFGRSMTPSGGYSWGGGHLPGLSGLNLNGTTGSATTSAAVLDSQYSYTVAAWVRPTATGYFKTVLEVDAAVSNPMAIGTDDAGHWAVWSRANDQVGGVNVIGPALTLNVWTHLAATYDAPTSLLRLYVNGNLVAQQTVPAAYSGNGKIALGHYTWQGGSYGQFAGDISEVAVYSGILSTPDIRQLATP